MNRPDRDWFAGSEIREAREDRNERHGRTEKQARELYRLAEKNASICGRCFRPLGPMDSVTMRYRKLGKYYWARLPVCLSCHLDDVAEYEHRPFRFKGGIWRGRCRNCCRPLRLVLPWYGVIRPPSLNAQTCCADCERLAKNKRNAERRRVEHAPMKCANPACGKIFVPTRADAVTCSGRCRQALHRERARAELGDSGHPLRKPTVHRERRPPR